MEKKLENCKAILTAIIISNLGACISNIVEKHSVTGFFIMITALICLGGVFYLNSSEKDNQNEKESN